MEINELLEEASRKKIKTLRVIEQPANISSPLEISVETGIKMEEVEVALKELENASFVTQEAGYYGITLEGMRTMKNLRKNKLI